MTKRALILMIMIVGLALTGVAVQAMASDGSAIDLPGAADTALPMDTEVEENENWKRTTTTSDNGVTVETTESKTDGTVRVKTSGSDGHGGTQFYDSEGNATLYVEH